MLGSEYATGTETGDIFAGVNGEVVPTAATRAAADAAATAEQEGDGGDGTSASAASPTGVSTAPAVEQQKVRSRP